MCIELIIGNRREKGKLRNRFSCKTFKVIFIHEFVNGKIITQGSLSVLEKEIWQLISTQTKNSPP